MVPSLIDRNWLPCSFCPIGPGSGHHKAGCILLCSCWAPKDMDWRKAYPVWFPLIDNFKRNIRSLILSLNLRHQWFYLQKARCSYSSFSKQSECSFSFSFVTPWLLTTFTVSWGSSERNRLLYLLLLKINYGTPRSQRFSLPPKYTFRPNKKNNGLESYLS